MKTLAWTLTLALTAVRAGAATARFAVDESIPIVDDGGRSYESLRQTYAFRVEVIGDDENAKGESRRGGRAFVAARPGERYSLRIYNPLPVRAAVNVAVDGLNTITGKPSGLVDGEKWMIEPGSFIVLRGWQVSKGESRRFFFTEKPGSYAAWQGDVHGLDLAANCGVIGAAFFWNSGELRDYLESHPVYRDVARPRAFALKRARGSVGESAGASTDGAAAPSDRAAAAPALAAEQKAGTGMGERESHPTEQVQFSFDAGMYDPSRAVLVYYDFPRRERLPNPFPQMSYAPEMPEAGVAGPVDR
jgi:hypothetical protein